MKKDPELMGILPLAEARRSQRGGSALPPAGQVVVFKVKKLMVKKSV